MDLLYLLYSLLRKKWIIVGCTLLGVAAGFTFTFLKKKQYVAFAQYSTGFTMENKVKITEDDNLNFYEIDLRFNNVIETFKSAKVLGMVSYKLMLHDLEDKRPFRQLNDDQKMHDNYKTANIAKVQDVLRRKVDNIDLISPYDPEEKKVYDLIRLYGYDGETLFKSLQFDRVGRTDFINIFFISENPELSAFVVNTIGDQFIRFFNSIYGIRTADAKVRLDSLMKEKERDVIRLTEKLRSFKDSVGPPSLSERAGQAMTTVTTLTSDYQKELAKLNGLRAELNSVNEQLRVLNIPTSVSVNNNAEIMRLSNANSQLELDKTGKSDEEKRQIQQKIDANSQKIIDLGRSNSPNKLKQIEKDGDKRDQLVGKKTDLIQQIIASERNVRLFEEEKNKYVAMINQGGGSDVVQKAIENDLETVTKEYNQLRNSLQGTLDLNVNPENNIKPVLPGQPPINPEPSRRLLFMGIAGVLMAFLSSFIILLLEFMDSSYKTPSIFNRAAKLKTLSIINRVDFKEKPLTDYFHTNGQTDRGKEETIFVENLRKLRYELEQSGKKIFLVTSTRASEGKTTVIEALANSFSLSKKKVLLIDANFSNNTLTDKFAAKPALEQFSVNGTSTAHEKFINIASQTPIPFTDIVGCKEGNYTPSEVLPKNNLLENLKSITSEYDFVFIEGAALNTHADSKELSKYVEGIISVFSARSSLRPTDMESIEYLKSTGNKFTGAVFNQVEPENMDM